MNTENKAKETGTDVFVLVPQVGSPVMNLQIVASQDVQKVENGVKVAPAHTDILTPNGFGVIALKKDHPNHERRMSAMKRFMGSHNMPGQPPFIIGPYSTENEAFLAMHKVRPKTDAERATEAEEKVKATDESNSQKDKEIEALREKLAKAGK